MLLECANTGWRSCICLDLLDAVLVALVGLGVYHCRLAGTAF